MKRILLLAASALLLTGCLAEVQPSQQPEPTPTPLDFTQPAQRTLADLPGVLEVMVNQEPLNQSSDVEPSEPEYWVVTLGVTMADVATAEEVAQAAAATLAYSEQNAVPGQWTAAIGFELIDTEPDDDLPAQDRSGFPVYPEGIDVQAFMAIKGAPGVQSVLVGSDIPFVTVGAASDLQAVQRLLNGSPLWQEGGRLWAELGRVRLTELPESLTPAGYELIIAASIAFPAAQFWLEAPTTGNGWPQLFVDQVSVDEAPAVAAALDGSVVAAPYDVNYFIRAIGPDGAIDTAGVLGSN